MAGYSGKPLPEKLGVKEGVRMAVVNAPPAYQKALGRDFDAGIAGEYGFIQFFTRSRRELEGQFPRLRSALEPDGMLWVSWPKASSKVETDLNENIVREIGLKSKLVDVKVCAVDDVWSGLKFVRRLRDRGR